MAESMYASVTKLQVKSGEDRAVKQYFTQWEKESDPIPHGVSSAYLIKAENDPETYYMVVTFENQDALQTYEQGREQQLAKLQALVTAQPEQHQGEIVSTIEG
ncbi:MAG TPA: antibiotic biosynthesis monooxygenase [Thermomicrobiaceae bacterium]|nr:antibiotic biosynthesis monooxygenase [Thermomicrobiaceae bacterium]